MAHVTDQLNTALADRYRIERELGQGGKALVYVATDLKHDDHRSSRPEGRARLPFRASPAPEGRAEPGLQPRNHTRQWRLPMSGITEKLRVAIVDRHVIEHELGQGGMADTTSRRADEPAGRTSDV